jgi:predicted dehydrogenase
MQKTGVGAATLSLGMTAASAKRVLGANDKIRFGLVGCGGRGLSLLMMYARDPRVEFAYLCDPDQNRGGREFSILKENHNPHLQRLTDFRPTLEDKNLDVLMVATPDHWHAPATILACQAGKDVFVEKPMSHNIWEGRKMVEAAAKYNRIVQVGMQTRSAPYAQKAVDYIRSGKLGTIHLCKIFNLKAGDPYHADKDYKPNDKVDMDLWLGPAREELAYVYQSKGWLYHWDFCNGDIMNDGIHQIDMARWLIGKHIPASAYSIGGNLAFQDDREVPDTQLASYEFGDMLVTIEVTQYAPYMSKTPMIVRETDTFPYWPQNATRIELYGTQGLMIFGRHGGGWQVFTTDGKVVAQEYGRVPDEPHKENFLHCLQTREKPNASAEEGHLSCLMVHMANIAYRLGGRKLVFDPAKEEFPHDAEANAMLKRAYRAPYCVPEAISNIL